MVEVSENLVTWDHDEGEQRVDNVTRAGNREKLTSGSRLGQAGDPHVDHRQLSRQPGLASTIAPGLSHHWCSADQAGSCATPEFDQSGDAPVTTVDPDERACVEYQVHATAP